MKYLMIIAIFIMAPIGTAHAKPKDSGFFGFVPLMNWPNNHWKAQNYNPSVQKDGEVIQASLNPSKSMFADINGIKPKDFVANLKRADIIESVYNRKSRQFWNEIITDDVIIELDYNFYTLSYSDQTTIADLLAKSYNREGYILKDASTKHIVGQITPSGLHLF